MHLRAIEVETRALSSFTEYVQSKLHVSVSRGCPLTCPQLELRPLTGMCKIESLNELEFKGGFANAAISRPVRLRECPLRELRLY